MADGTTSVDFNDTDPKRIVGHKINGYLAKPYNVRDLANAIEWGLEDNSKLKELSKDTRTKAKKSLI